MGPETGTPDRVSYVMKQSDIWMILTTPLRHDDPLNIWLTLHGDGVRDIAFEVEDAADVFKQSTAAGATAYRPRRTLPSGPSGRGLSHCPTADA